jgi:hypothetical protein
MHGNSRLLQTSQGWQNTVRGRKGSGGERVRKMYKIRHLEGTHMANKISDGAGGSTEGERGGRGEGEQIRGWDIGNPEKGLSLTGERGGGD